MTTKVLSKSLVSLYLHSQTADNMTLGNSMGLWAGLRVSEELASCGPFPNSKAMADPKLLVSTKICKH